ncbi:MAG: glycosyltransferase family 9 protein [bacterium]|nr:glycosyltransferase family 9 protein [bacterium]
MPDVRSILIFRNGSIGNTLAAVPALKCIRTSYPQTRITVVVDAVGRELLLHCPYMDELIVYDKRGQHSGVSGFVRTAVALRRTAPDRAILFKRFYRNGLLAFLSGATDRIGYATAGRAPFLTSTIPYDESVHVAELNLRLARHAGAHTVNDAVPELHFSTEELAAFADWRANFGIRDPYVAVHFGGVTGGASFVAQEWRAPLVRGLCASRQVLLVGRGAREVAEAEQLHEQLPESKLALNLPLRLSMLLISHAVAFIGTNSGPMHLAAAARVPGIALFRNDERFDVERVKWRPQFDQLAVVPVGSEDTAESFLSKAENSWPSLS